MPGEHPSVQLGIFPALRLESFSYTYLEIAIILKIDYTIIEIIEGG